MKTILFVCTANICRSPMAAAIMRRRLAEAGLGDGPAGSWEGVQVRSAGVYAEEGHAASTLAVRTLGERGMDLTAHRSQAVTPALLKEADIVLVMEERHRRSLFYLEPRLLHKVFLLSEMSGGHADVDDPFGGPEEDYQHAADRLERLIETGLPMILKQLKVAPARQG